MKISVLSLKKVYKNRAVVNDVHLYVEEGEVVGLLGTNGAGKTTTFYMIVGIVAPDEGTIIMGDEDITAMPLHERSRKGIGYLPQEASVFRGLTVEDNIKAILETTSLSAAEQEVQLELLLEEFSIQDVRQRKGSELSGGERRRVEIARALASDPKFILLDEPFAGVDPIAVGDIQSIIRHLKARQIGILITDHNVRETLTIVDRAYIMREGQILVEGDPQEIAHNEIAKEYYLGKTFRI